ncbi:hypothetical protein TIFTF001_020760 [Ficus carica]|uniref:Uncharacterized protein n=1 Tax=Ficus carica TaxID=3494 RepID=A0AA88ABD8_FICCA|nr:hypothetical protein TIFTF001_020760 [Ficus carica]
MIAGEILEIMTGAEALTEFEVYLNLGGGLGGLDDKEVLPANKGPAGWCCGGFPSLVVDSV